MSVWQTYPPDYRAAEVRAITSAVRAGECAAVVGLSGSGKSNLLGIIAYTQSTARHAFVLADCNRLSDQRLAAVFRLLRGALGDQAPAPDELSALDDLFHRRLEGEGQSLTLLLDRFDALPSDAAVFNSLRALRDAHKFRLTFVTATRRPVAPLTELAELFYAHTLWLGPLSESDARWNVHGYAERLGLKWNEATAQSVISISRGYPSLLRAVCEAHAGGAALEVKVLLEHPAVRARLDEFWADHPSDDDLRRSGLAGHALLAARPTHAVDTSQLTAKEHLLFNYLAAHPNAVCEKDDLIRAVWPEDRVLERGVRDDSLAQLVRRLREKIEADPANPRLVHTVPGRGYRFTPR